ncbi:Imelysin [Prevotellaceae bacterium MN60]|nr:Imelysin [Prevotellaceae bacterium MN60]
MKKYLSLSVAVILGALTLTSCSEDNNDDNGKKGDIYSDVTFGNAAMDACDDLGKQLESANSVIAAASLSDAQEAYLYEVLDNLVDNVIVPTYTKLADDTEDLEKTLNGLNVNTITQEKINKACDDFKSARENWERSEAFLGGAASDFDVDPTIDSWPLNRSLLLTYLQSGRTDFSDEEIEDATILGFHALEFFLFRNGQPRNVAEFKDNDTYPGFTAISGASELAYAQRICTLLKERTFQLQVAWEGEKNASRAAVVKAAGLEYTTENGMSFGDNLKQAGKNSQSTFASLTDAITQVLSADEGSCFGICNEVGTAKIANPFANGDIAYVESPYSYNSITDFADNIRSIRNVWYGSTNGSAATKSFHGFFAQVGKASVNTAVENGFNTAISNISGMPSPFVKYCSVVSGKNFDDQNNWESTSGEEEE